MGSNIPKDATSVFEGILFDTYHKQVEQFDGSFKTFERVRGYDIAKAICIVDNKIIIQEEYQPGGVYKKGLPGGFLEKLELPIDAIKREITEENGYIYQNIQEFVNIPSNFGLLEAYRYYFIAKNPIQRIEPNLDTGGEKIIIHYYSFDEFISGILDETINIYELSNYIIKNYILPNKLEDFKKLLFE